MQFILALRREVLTLVAISTMAFGTSPVSYCQDVGMGEREGTGKRFEEPYTLEIETPHIKWAKPLAGGPIRVLAVPSVQEGRSLVELAQRFDLELTTVSIDPAWDVNKWTMSFGEDYGARAERGDLKLVYGYLEEELVGDKQFDVILLPLHHGWDALTPRSRQALEDRVRAGCGLVLIRPFGGELSPLQPQGDVDEPRWEYGPVEPAVESSPWRRTGDHYLTRAVPVESFPFHLIENYRYRLAPGAEALIDTESGTPVLGTMTFGSGRVVAFGFRNIGLSWRMPFSAMEEPVDVYWEYFYALVGRSILWAASREPDSLPSGGRHWTRWVLRSEAGNPVTQGDGPPSDPGQQAPGRYFLEKYATDDWEVSVLEVPRGDFVRNLTVTPPVIAPGQPVTVTFEAGAEADVSIEDGFGRVLAATKKSPGSADHVTLRPDEAMTHGGFVRVVAGDARATQSVRFAAANREWDDYEVILPWYGPNSYQPWIPALDRQFREIGITTLEDPERNFKIIASVHEPAFGIYWYNRQSYVDRKAEYLKTGDKSLIRRNVSLHSSSLLEDIRTRFLERVGDQVPLRPFAYYLADESSVTCYADAYDVDWSEDDLSAFREWLQEEYRSLEALNTTWDTAFEAWSEVVPMTTSEAQKHGNFAPWSDHRVFMEEAFIRTIREAGRIAREIDPGARASFSGTQIPTPHNGCNWYEIDQVTDYLQPYSGGNQDSMHFLFNPDLRLTGFTGYGLTEEDVQAQVWRRLFYGHSGASIFWHYTLMNPDLTLSSQGRGLARAIGKIQSGVGRIFMNSSVAEDGVAIHFSMASIRGAWITDGRIVEGVTSAQRSSENFRELMKRRDLWVEELERRGVQFRFLATPQIEAGELENYRALILPYSIALSDKEVEEIERFSARGGKVFIDDQAGRMDEKCRWRDEQLWTRLPAGFQRSGPTDPGVSRVLEVAGDSLTTVRTFGQGRLVGLLPSQNVTVRLPEADGVRYDLWRGGAAGETVEAGPARPILLLERETGIARLEVGEDLTVRLLDEAGQPVDRSVISVQVMDPSGAAVHYYSGNLDLVDGTARFEIPFALSDPAGEWTVRVADVISGLVAEHRITRGPGPNTE